MPLASDLSPPAAPLAASAGTRARAGRVTIVRESALPYAVLDLQVSAELEALATEILALEAALSAPGEQLAAALHRAIPRFTAPDRKVALQLKRGIFNHRLAVPAEVAERLIGCAQPGLLKVFGTWRHRAERRAALLDLGEARTEAEGQASLEAMIRAALADPQFCNGLAVTAPGVFARLGDLDRGGKRARYARAKLAKYIIRTANKTAPLNQLAALSLLVDGLPACSQVEVEARPAQDLVGRIARGQPLDHQRLILNESLTWSGHVCSFWGAVLGPDGRTRDGIRHLRLPAACARVLQALDRDATINAADLKEQLARASDPTQGAAILRTLVAARALVPRGPDGLGETLDQAVEGLEGLGARDAALATRKLDAVLSCPAQSAQARAAAIAAFASEARVEAGAEGKGEGNTAYETLWRPARVPPEILQAAEGPVAELIDLLPSWLEVTPLYARLLRDFTRDFGQGGACRDLFGWLSALQLEGGRMPQPTGPGPRPQVGGALGVTFYYSLQRRSPAEDLRLYLQAAHCHAGWQLGRFGFGRGRNATQLRTALARDLREHAAPARPVTLAIDSDSHNIQANPALFEPVLTFPGQTPPRKQRLSPLELTARHDPDTNRIRLFYDRQEIHLLYNGGMLPFAHLGLGYVLNALVEPFRVRALTEPLQPPADRRVTEVASTAAGQVVLSRRQWWIPGELIAPLADTTPFLRRLALRRLWEAHALPTRFYGCGFTPAAGGRFVRTPPSRSASHWLDIRLDASAGYLLEAAAYDWVLIQENTNEECEALGRSGAEGRLTSIMREAYYKDVRVSL